MDRVSARIWLVWMSLAITFADIVFFVVAPTFGYPLTQPEAFRMLQIVAPGFLAYLGTAARFVFEESEQPSSTRSGRGTGTLLGLIVKGPVYLFLAASVGAICAFGWQNRREASGGVTFGVEELAWILSLAMGFSAGVTNYVVAKLFGSTLAVSDAAPAESTR